MELVRKQTYITTEQDRAVKRLARREGVTEAEIVRRALESWLSGRGMQEGTDPFAGMIGIFDGPVVIDHDDIYK